MRKKFVQTLAARQLEYGDHIRAGDEMDSEKHSSAEQHQQQQQVDGSGEEIIEILDDDQEVELMMERHRKYHPRKYVNLQHPPSKIYYDKIDKVVSPLGDKEDQEDEDERNQLVIAENGPKELNNNSISAVSTGGIGSSYVGGGSLDDSVLPLGSSIPMNEEEAYLLQGYHYRRLYGGGFGAVGSIPLNVAPGGRPSTREHQQQQQQQQQQSHQLRLKKPSQRPLDPPGPLMGPPAYPHPVGHHPPPYERSHPYGQRPVSYDRSVTAPQTPYYRRREERRASMHERPRAAQPESNGTSYLVPAESRTEYAKAAGNRNSAFSPPRDKGHQSTRVSEANKTSAPPMHPATPSATVASSIVTPRTPTYYQTQSHAYQRSSADSGNTHRSREANSFLALDEFYRTGFPPPHMLTTTDLQTMYYYHYFLDKMAAAPSVYHHPYRDHTLTTTSTTVGMTPGIGAIGSGPPGSGAIAALGAPSAYPPPQYGFAKSPTDQTALYGAQQQPFDYTVYHHTVLAQSGYVPTPTCQSLTAISPASIVPSASATSSSTPAAAEIIRPSVINRAPIPTTVPQNVPRTVPVNLVHPPGPPNAYGGGSSSSAAAMTITTIEKMAYSSTVSTSGGSEHDETILKPLLTRPLAITDGDGLRNASRHGGDSIRSMAHVAAISPNSSGTRKPSDTAPPMSSSGVPSKPRSSSASPRVDNGAPRQAAPNSPGVPIIPLTVPMTPSRPRGRPPGTKNKESSAAARAAKANSAAATSPNASPAAKGPTPPAVQRVNSSNIRMRVDCMKQEVECFLNRRRTEVITTMRLYSIGRIDFDGLLQEMKRHSIVYRDFLAVAYELIKNAGLPGFVREPPAELDYRWKCPPQEFADYFAQNEQCSRTFVKENFDFLSLIVDNLLKQYFEPLEYFLLTYVLGLRMK